MSQQTENIKVVSVIHNWDYDEYADLSYLEDPDRYKRDYLSHCLVCHKEKLYQKEQNCYFCDGLVTYRRTLKEEIERYKEEDQSLLRQYGNTWVHLVLTTTIILEDHKGFTKDYFEALGGIEYHYNLEQEQRQLQTQYIKDTENEHINMCLDQLKRDFGFIPEMPESERKGVLGDD